MAPVKLYLAVITLLYMVCMTPGLNQHYRRKLPEWRTHAEERSVKKSEVIDDTIRSSFNLRQRRQHDQSQHRTSTNNGDNQSQHRTATSLGNNQSHHRTSTNNGDNQSQHRTATSLGNNQSPHRTSSTNSGDQPQQIPTESSYIQKLIDDIFTFPNSKPVFQIERKVFLPSLSWSPTDLPPECAHGHRFCVGHVEDYPTDLVEQLVAENISHWSRFNTDDILTNEEQEIIDRGHEDSDEVPLCESQVYKKDVTQVKSGDNSWLFVVQSSTVKQLVRLEVCSNPDSECDRIVKDGLANIYRSSCKQKYIIREMLLLNRTSSSLVSAPVPLPSCCSCVVTKRAVGDRFMDHDSDERSNSDEVVTYSALEPNRGPMVFHQTKKCSQHNATAENQTDRHTHSQRVGEPTTSGCPSRRWLAIGMPILFMFIINLCL